MPSASSTPPPSFMPLSSTCPQSVTRTPPISWPRSRAALPRQALHPLIARIRDVDLPAAIDCDSGRVVELAGVGTVEAPGADRRAVRTELLDVAAGQVGDVDVTRAVERDAGGAGVEIPR